MASEVQTLQQVAALAVCLSPEDKIRLIEIVAAALERDLTATDSDTQASLQSGTAGSGVTQSQGKPRR